MIQFTGGVLQRCLNVFRLQIREFFKNLAVSQARSQEIKHIGHPHTQSANTRTAATLLRIDRDARVDFDHIIQ